MESIDQKGDLVQRLNTLVDFFETEYKEQIAENLRKDKHFLIVDFSDLIKCDPSLAEEFLESPDEAFEAAEDALRTVVDSLNDFSDQSIGKFHLRFKNLPKSQEILIRDIRSKEIGKLWSMQGVVRQKSDVRPQVTTARFECPACGQTFNILQLDSNFNEPTRCGCGRKGKFRLVSKELVDAQGIVLEEDSENLEGGEQPKRMNILLKDDLVSPLSERKTNPGSKIQIIGIVKEVPLIGRTGQQSTRFDLIIEANYVVAKEEGFYDVQISNEEKEQILKLSKDPKIMEKMISSIAPSIYGHEKIKEAIVLQLLGGIHKKRTDGIQTRGDIHILLIGDPGSGKSQLLKRVQIIAPKGRYVSGKGASGAGLTATVVRDEFLKGWSLEAGALVLANNGICCIDELDKMTVEDTSAMHEALEQQTISISKANIQATLICRTTVLAAANPKFGRFDPYDVLAKQIDMPPALINRFDLIFPIKDIPEIEKDEKMASHILGLHQSHETEEPEIPTKILRKYIAYARQKCKPKITEGALLEIKKYYVEMRNSDSANESAMRSVPISARQLEALIRLAEASAKVRLSPKVTRKDAKTAIELLHFCLSTIGIDPETGKIDIDRLTTGITTSQRTKIIVIKEIIDELENKIGKTIPIDDLAKEAEVKGIKDIDSIIENLKRSGDIFEPKRGFIQRI